MDIEVLTQQALQLGRRLKIAKMMDAIILSGIDEGPESCPLRHYFAPGQYAREISMRKGMIVVGKIHKHAHVNIISKGHVRVFTEGEGEWEMQAPCTFISSPGTQRVVYMLEDTVWTTVHVTDKTDIDEIEAEIIAKDYTEVP